MRRRRSNGRFTLLGCLLAIVDTWSGKLYQVRNPAGAVFPTVLDDCALEPPP